MNYPLSTPHGLHPEAIAAGCRVLRAGQITMGRHVEAFEDAFARYIGRRHAIMVNSGSSANLLATRALVDREYWTPAARIAVPALCWPTSVWPVIHAGLRPVFHDVDPRTLGRRVPAQGHAVTGGGHVVIHVLGAVAGPVPLEPTLEDCCEACGTPTVGTQGTVSTFSFFYSHQLCIGEGGAILTDHDELADHLRSLRAHGWTRERSDRARQVRDGLDPRFTFVTAGFNVRPTEMQGAIGCVQLQHLPEVLETKIQTAAAIRAMLPAWLQIPNPDVGIPWMNLPLIVDESAPVAPRDVVQAFEGAGIETRPILTGNYLRHPAMHGVPCVTDPAGYPVADRVMDRGFMMGCHGEANTATACLEQALATLKVTLWA